MSPLREVFATPSRSVLAVSLLLAACGGGEQGTIAHSTAPVEPAVRDSAGITIYELPADVLERAPLVTMDAEPIAVIGSDRPEEDVSKVDYLVFLSDHRTVAFDGAEGNLMLFGADGRIIRRIGRRGEGPGEFAGVSYFVVLAGDTVVVSDQGSSRVSVIGPDSGVVRSFAAPLNGRGSGHAAATRLVDGRWVLVPEGYSLDPRAGPGRPLYPILAMAESAGIEGHRDTLGQVEGIEIASSQFRSSSGKMVTTVGIARFTPLPYVWPVGEGFAVLPGDQYLIRIFGNDGRLRSLVRVLRSRPPVSPEMLEAAIQEDLRRARAAGSELPQDRLAQYEEQLRAGAVPDSLPAFGLALPAGDLLWVSDYPDPSLEQVGYTAVGATGRIIGRLSLSRSARPVAFGADRIALRTEDEDGIRRYELHKLHFAAASP